MGCFKAAKAEAVRWIDTSIKHLRKEVKVGDWEFKACDIHPRDCSVCSSVNSVPLAFTIPRQCFTHVYFVALLAKPSFTKPWRCRVLFLTLYIDVITKLDKFWMNEQFNEILLIVKKMRFFCSFFEDRFVLTTADCQRLYVQYTELNQLWWICVWSINFLRALT